MGDSFRTIVHPVASLADAPALADKVIAHLIKRKIVGPVRTDCVLGKAGGYPPGDNVGEALATWSPSAGSGVPLSLETIVRDLRRSSCNGVREVVGRTVFHNFGAGLDVVRCPICVGNEVDAHWSDAVGRWYDGDDHAAFKCSDCNEDSPITQWTFDPPWAFGNLGFEFWNWPPVKKEFIDQVSEILGHKVVLITGKV
jgi:hypothetical protein